MPSQSPVRPKSNLNQSSFQSISQGKLEPISASLKCASRVKWAKLARNDHLQLETGLESAPTK